MTRCVPFVATAQNNLRAGAQQTVCQAFCSAAVRAVHVVPSGDVITRCVPSEEVAQNIPRNGDQQTLLQVFDSAALWEVQVTPVEDTETAFAATPLPATAQ